MKYEEEGKRGKNEKREEEGRRRREKEKKKGLRRKEGEVWSHIGRETYGRIK